MFAKVFLSVLFLQDKFKPVSWSNKKTFLTRSSLLEGKNTRVNTDGDFFWVVLSLACICGHIYMYVVYTTTVVMMMVV